MKIEEPRVLHALSGRVRVHIPEWSGQERRALEAQLRRMPGVLRIQTNALTGNVLLLFDAKVTDEQAVLRNVQDLIKRVDMDAVPEEERPAPAVLQEREGRVIRARVAVRGLDRDPEVAQRLLKRLEQYSGVRARVNVLTGRVLLEFPEHEADLDELIATVTGMDLPDLPEEDDPAHPLDPGPLLQSMIRTVGAALGLGLLATRRLFGVTEAIPGAGVAIQISSVIGILQGIPPLRYGLRRVLGRTVSDLLFNLPGIVTLTIAGSPLGLALTGGESLRLLTEVRARQGAWRRYEEQVANAPSAQPDATIRLEAGDRVPLAAEVVEGTGTALGRDGMPVPIMAGSMVAAGAKLSGGPFTVRLQAEASFEAFTPEPRPAPIRPSLYQRYYTVTSYLSLAYAVAAGLFTRSFGSVLTGLLLVNPRTAVVGADSADLSAATRVLRAGVTVVGTRKNRAIRLPDVLLLDGARLLMNGLELADTAWLTKDDEATSMLRIAASVSQAAGSPWGAVFKEVEPLAVTQGHFDGKVAAATVGEKRYTLVPVTDWSEVQQAAQFRQRGNYVLVLRDEQQGQVIGVLALRPCLADGITELVERCAGYGVKLGLLSSGDQLAVRALAQRAHVAYYEDDDALHFIRMQQQEGAIVAFVSDNVGASAAFAACDLAIGLTDLRSRFQARADYLAPDLTALTAIIEAGARRNATVRDSIGLSMIANIVGAIWGLRGLPGIEVASRVVYVSALGAIADGWARMRGGKRTQSSMSRLVDPRPERWGQREIKDVLQTLNSSERGLTAEQVAERIQPAPAEKRGSRLFTVLLDQLRNPLIGILAAGATLTLLLGATGDVIIIGSTILINVAVGIWQEYKADRVVEALKELGTATARVIRDGETVVIPAREVVPGDILSLAPGDRVAADARVISAHGLEVDEAALTGESLPVMKAPDGPTDASRVVLEGSDITTGIGWAVVVAVGRGTRMGATTAVLEQDEEPQSQLGTRLSQLLRLILPLSLAGGAIVVLSGWLWQKPLIALLATGATIALAGVPEGLPLLTRVGEAGMARRLAKENALVRRLSSVEALGRVDVACTDKTGTMTRGELALSLVADSDGEAQVPGELEVSLSHVLLTAALASPHPDAPDARAHPTDVAVIRGAQHAGLGEQMQIQHEAELSFDPVRSFHATIAGGRLCIKGAAEELIPRCTRVGRNGEWRAFDEGERQRWLERSHELAARGLRLLMVAEGSSATSLENPQELSALGFIGISDPLRPTVQEAVRRCHEAGVRVLMITGDHPATARTIAREAGLLNNGGVILTADEVEELEDDELDERLEHAVVVARATPLDKLRIIESLQRRGHTVAMTGDGVNDAPALRLANVGVAMGRSGTEVARQAADVVIADDDFSTLVDGFVEGRSFWRNLRRALSLLIGGNLGELGLVVGASVLGLGTPLTARQILAVNAITDILPAMAVTLQQPEHHNLAGLQREGASALNKPLRNEILRRGFATTVPSLLSYILMLSAGPAEARSVAFASIVATQLAQTLEMGRTEGGLTKSVLSAVLGSAGVMVAAFAIPTLRTFLQLAVPGPWGWALIGGGAVMAVALNRLLASAWFNKWVSALRLPQGDERRLEIAGPVA